MKIYDFRRICLLICLLAFSILGCKKVDENIEADTTINQRSIDVSKINFNSSITYGAVIDADGNTYKTVMIGTQTWMAENLRTSRFNDGEQIPIISDNQLWSNCEMASMCFYNNDSTKYKSLYGGLYNWYTVNSGKLAPKGWHIPSDKEWQILYTFLDGATNAGGKIKEVDTIHWESPNFKADNISGFTALPAGFRIYSGEYYDAKELAKWWSSSVDPTIYAWGFFIRNNISHIGSYNYDKKCGLSVRCVKD